jgi:CheY-like chemotaxis protein
MKNSLFACKVLVVEDVHEARLLVRQILGRLGVTVIEAEDGLEGIRLARQELPDLILMDLSLPLVDGWEATRALKADRLTAHIPIVIVSAHSMYDDPQRVKDLGCVGYVMKPLEPSVFAQYVKEVLLEGAPHPQPG